MRKMILVLTILFTCVAFGKGPVKAALLHASETYNVSYELLSKIAHLESGFDYKIKSKTASARGLFQITKATEKGLKKQCKIKGNIFNPKVNALLAACGLSKGITYLKKKLRRNPNNVEIYLFHFLGHYHSWRFLRFKSGTKMAKYFPKQAKANKWIFYRKNKPRTKIQMYRLFEKKLRKARVL